MIAAQLRKVALSLPEAEERETWETATFRVRGKIFAMCSERERHVWIKATFDEQQALIQMDPEAFFVPPYVGSKGWIGVVLRHADRGEVADLVTEAWRMTAPKRLVKAFDEREGAA
ncbi:MAG: MmcQ/YjbR family DNA-binding protein [Planctomycetaceae bacterium]